MFFRRATFARDETGLSEGAFPQTRQQLPFYTYRMIAYDGGYWLVRDILSRSGERGFTPSPRNRQELALRSLFPVREQTGPRRCPKQGSFVRAC